MRLAAVIMGTLGVLGLGVFGMVWHKSAARSSGVAEHALIAKTDRPPATRIQHLTQAQAADIPAKAYTSATSVESQSGALARASQETTASVRPTRNVSVATSELDSAPAGNGIAPCNKPGGMGLSRIVEIDTTGGPG